jgi:hypothetical protein
MQTQSKFAWVVGFLLIALGLGLGIGWLTSRPDSKVQVVGNQVSPPPKPDPMPVEKTNKPVPAPVIEAPAPVVMTPPVETSTNWEEKLDNVLLSDADESSKADSILALMPYASNEGKVELAQHLVNLVQDDHYSGAAELLTNSATSEEVSTVLLNDLLNRNNTLKLPMLLAVARQEDHPLKTEAKDMLELFLQEDDGTNWDQWDTAINKWLEENQE